MGRLTSGISYARQFRAAIQNYRLKEVEVTLVVPGLY